MRFLLALILLLSFSVGATTYTEFYVQTTGANTNSGHTTDDAATFYAAAGNWTNTTGTFYKSGLNPAAGGVTNGAWAAIYLDAYPTNAMYIGLITNADDTADVIQVNLVAYAGVNPVDSVGAMSISVGGAWKGFTTATMANGGGFPLNFLGSYATNTANVFPRCNIKSGTIYSIASTITHSITGPTRWQGYTTSAGDGGQATIDGGAVGTSYTLVTVSGARTDLQDLIFSNNGNTGTGSGVISSGNHVSFMRCVFHDVMGYGANVSGGLVDFIECEAYACNKGNASGRAGFSTAVQATYIRCISHDNAGSNSDGFNGTVSCVYINCIAESNGGRGFTFSGSTTVNALQGCDSYNNTGSGIDISATGASALIMENCNIFKNGAYGITSSGSSLKNGLMYNCAFGSGTQTNTSGNIALNLGGINEIGTVTYTADQTPWTDPANGDFRIASTATLAKAAGRGSFTQTQASYAGTVAYPDIGAAQSASTNATSGGGSYTFAQ